MNGAELLYLPISGSKVIEVIKISQKMGWSPKKLGSDGLLANVRQQHSDALTYLDGLLTIDIYTEQKTLSPLHRKAKKAYRKLYGDSASTFVAAGAEGLAILIDAINRCDDSGNRECFNTMLRSTENFEGLMGIVSIGPDGKAIRSLIVNTIKNGKMKFVVKVY